jgi:hypothetical protein
MANSHRLDLKQSQSPLANLVRRTSSRGIKGRQFQWQENDSASNQQKMLYLDIERSLSITVPQSPLLHTHFARDSTATASSFDDNSCLDTSVRSSNYGFGYFEDDTEDRDKPENFPNIQHLSNDTHPFPSQQERDPRQVKGTPFSVASVFNDPPMNNSVDSATIRDGPIIKPVTNFSRPIHKSGHAGAMGERVMPQLPPDMRKQKLKVLERNARRGVATSPTESIKARSPLSQTTTDMDALSIQNGSNPGTPSLRPLN